MQRNRTFTDAQAPVGECLGFIQFRGCGLHCTEFRVSSLSLGQARQTYQGRSLDFQSRSKFPESAKELNPKTP